MFHARLFFLYHKRSIIGSYTLFYAFQPGLNNYLAAFFSRYRDAITYHFRVMCIRIIVYARWSIYVYITFHDKMHGHVYLVDWTIKFYIVEYYVADSSNAKNSRYLFIHFHSFVELVRVMLIIYSCVGIFNLYNIWGWN